MRATCQIEVHRRLIRGHDYLPHRRVLFCNAVCNNYVEFAYLSLNFCQKAIQFLKVGYVPSQARQSCLDILKRASQLWTPTTHQEDVRAFIDKLLRDHQHSCPLLTRYEDTFPFELSHMPLCSPKYSMTIWSLSSRTLFVERSYSLLRCPKTCS